MAFDRVFPTMLFLLADGQYLPIRNVDVERQECMLTGTSPFSDLFMHIVPPSRKLTSAQTARLRSTSPVMMIRTRDSGKLKSGSKCAIV